MGLIKRNEKGSKLTVEELDGNLTYLESIGISNLNQPTNNVIGLERLNGEIVSGSFNSYNTDIEEIVNEDVVIYKNTQYDNFDEPSYEIILKDNNGEPIELLDGESCFLDCNLTVFGNETKSGLNIVSVYGRVNSIQLQSDGKILVGGFFSSYNGVSVNNIVRLNSDGSIDNTFNIGTGIVFSDDRFTPVNSIQLQSDGKILVGGIFTSYNGTSVNNIVRLNSDGSIDNAFNTGGGFDGIVQTIQLQSDGKILIGGYFTSYNGTTSNYIIRLNSDGSIDNTFNIGTGFIRSSQFLIPVASIQIQSDGKILVGGGFNSYNGTSVNNIIRLNSDGSVDNTFSIGTGFNSAINSIRVQSDGKILVGGDFITYNGRTNNRLIRLNSDGSRDDTFNVGNGFSHPIEAIQLQSDGKILVGNTSGLYNDATSSRLLRLNSDGSLDETFNIQTGFDYVVFEGVTEIQVQSNGKILVGGRIESYYGVPVRLFLRLNPDGTIDNFNLSGNESYNTFSLKTFKKRNTQYNTDFFVGGGFSNRSYTTGEETVQTVQIQSDNKILVGGNFTLYNGTLINRMVRLNSSGSVDSTFNVGAGFNDLVRTITLQSNGSVVVGGGFTSYNGTTTNRVVRLTSSGSIDNTFSIGTGFNGVIRAITIQSDGKILVGGDFTSYSGTTRNRLIRLNSDGSIDNAFSIGTGFNNLVRTIAIQSDGKILVGGDFTAYNGVTRNYTIRLNSDGSRDDTFSIGTGFNNLVRTIAIQSDGKVLIGGNFTLYNGTTKNRIIRLNSNGSIDNTFRMGIGFPGFGNYVQVIQLQPDGKFFVSGILRSYSIAEDYFRENLIKLNSDGSLDTTFVPYQFNLFATSIQTQSNGKILMGGDFGILRLTETGLNSTDDGISFTKFFITQTSLNQYNNIPNGTWLSPNDEVVKIKSYLPINKSMISYKLIKIK